MATDHRVLLVEPDEEERDRLGNALEGAGYGVLECPGPSEPDYTCLRSRGAPCPLSREADVIVLDMRLNSAESLLGLYLMDRKRVIALGSHPGSALHGQLQWLQRRPSRTELLSAMAALDRRIS